MSSVSLPAFENESKLNLVSFRNESRISVSVLETPAGWLIKMKVPLTGHMIKFASHKLSVTSMYVLIAFSFCADGSGGIT